MKQTKEELLGSRIGAALTACGSKVEFSGCINFILVDYSKEEIKQLIMEYNNHQKPQNHE